MAKPDLESKLKEGAVAWNQWRTDNSDASIDLMDVDLRDAELPRVNLRDADLRACNLRDAILDGADLSSTHLTSAKLTGAQLRAASLKNEVANHPHFNIVDASDADFSGAKIHDGNFGGARLVSTDLRHAVIRDSNFNGTKLNKRNLTQTDLRDSQLQNAILEDASLEGADLRRCILSNASLKSANLSNVKLNGADLNQGDLTNARLTRSDLRGVTGLNCEQLTQAQDWETAYRDDMLACGGLIPDLSKTATLDVHSSSIAVTSTSPTLTVTGEVDEAVAATAAKAAPETTVQQIDEAIRQRFNETPATIVARARQARDMTIVLQTILDDMRLNSPEAGQAKALLEKQVETLDDIVAKLQSNGDKDTAQKTLLNLLYDVLESFLRVIADQGPTRGVLAMAAIASLRLTGVDTGFIVETLVAGSIVGIDAKALERILSGWKKKKGKDE